MEEKLASSSPLSLCLRTQHVGFTARPRALVGVGDGANLIYHDTPRRRCISHELLSSLLTHIPVICIKIACAQTRSCSRQAMAVEGPIPAAAPIFCPSCIVVGRHFWINEHRRRLRSRAHFQSGSNWISNVKYIGNASPLVLCLQQWAEKAHSQNKWD